MSAAALELSRIARRFGPVVALAEADLSVARGSVHAVLGENGAGKTTLMRIAYGMIQPDTGGVHVEGKGRAFATPANAIAAGIGMVQQHPSNVGAMTVWENVILGGRGAVDRARTRDDVRALIETLGFSLQADSRVDELPVAAQQRLEILRAVHRKARILILDEPTAVLAPEEATELYRWLRGFADQGGSVVVVTHKLDEARRYADDVTVLRAGRTVLQSRSAIVSANDLTRAMIGETLEAPDRTPATVGAREIVFRADDLTLIDERRLAVIRGASLHVRGGEIVGVAGVEGSGYHNLLLAMAGRAKASSGTMTTVAGVAMIPEDRHRNAVVTAFTLEENAVIKDAGGRRGRIRWTTVADQVRRFIEHYDVRASGPKAVMQTLSGGNQQKFVLARELDGNPPLVIAENPTRGLDVRASAFIRAQLRLARDRGAGVVLYSSDLDEILDLADRVLVVYAGAVIEAPLDRTRIGAAMLGAA